MSPMEWWCGLVVFVGKNRLDQAEAFKQHSQSFFFFFPNTELHFKMGIFKG